MRIETWRSNKGQEEIHHFVEGEQDTYVFGINAQLLGTAFYGQVLSMVQNRLAALEHSPWNFAKK